MVGLMVLTIILSPLGQSYPKFPEHCCRLTCGSVQNLAQIVTGFPELFPKDLFFELPNVITIQAESLCGFHPKALNCMISSWLQRDVIPPTAEREY